MNQTPNPINSTPTQPTTPKSVNYGLIKTIIITIVVLIVIVLGSVIGMRYYNEKTAQDRVNKDQTIIKTLFDLRTNATTFYASNKSYQNWWPQSQALTLAQQLGTTIIYRKPDYQNYIFYAYIPTHEKYFCIDTTGFADEVVRITDQQDKCN